MYGTVVHAITGDITWKRIRRHVIARHERDLTAGIFETAFVRAKNLHAFLLSGFIWFFEYFLRQNIQNVKEHFMQFIWLHTFALVTYEQQFGHCWIVFLKFFFLRSLCSWLSWIDCENIVLMVPKLISWISSLKVLNFSIIFCSRCEVSTVSMVSSLISQFQFTNGHAILSTFPFWICDLTYSFMHGSQNSCFHDSFTVYPSSKVEN